MSRTDVRSPEHSGGKNSRTLIQAELPVDEAIDGYEPNWTPEWKEIRHVAIPLVKAAHPASYNVAREYLRVAIDFILWCWKVAAMDLDVDEMFTGRNVARYVHTLPHQGRTSREKAKRGFLARLVKSHTGVRPKFPTMDQTSVTSFTPERIAEIASFTATRRTVRMNRASTIIVALAAGAGLDHIEMEQLRYRDLGLGVVHVTGGDHPRVVPILPDWRPDLDPLNGPEDEYILLPKKQRHTRRGRMLRDFIHELDDNPIDVRHLRTTWLLTLLRAGVGPLALRQLAGFKTFQALDRYIPFMPAIDHTQLFDQINTITLEMPR